MERINRELLERVFDTIRHRPGVGGKQLAYIEAHEVAQRLNDAFDGRYSFEIVKLEECGAEVLAHGALSVRLDDGTVVRKENVGSAEVRLNKTSGEVEGLGDTYKSAVSDCLKRCAAFGFGVGLHLYRGDEIPQAAPKPRTGTTTSLAGLSQAQRGAIAAIGKAKGMSAAQLDALASKEFSAPVDGLSKSQASQLIQALQALDAREAV